MRSTTGQAQETKLRTYADDWKLFAQGLRRKAAQDIVGGFVTATDEPRRTGMVVCCTKSVILASKNSAKAVLRQVAGAFGAQVAIHVKDLGVDDTLAATRGVPAQRKRVGDALASAGPIAKPPHGWKGRARLTASLSRNQSVGDGNYWAPRPRGGPPQECLRAVSGGSAARRAPEVIVALIAPWVPRPCLGSHTPGHPQLGQARRHGSLPCGVGCPGLDEGDRPAPPRVNPEDR